MCGIGGFKDIPYYFEDMLEANSKRGGYSFGILSFWDNQPEYVKVKHDKWRNFMWLLKRVPSFFQFRAPTTGEQDKFVLDENYPIVYKLSGGKIAFLFGNAVTSDEWFRKVKDEDNNNDLYYIGKNVLKYGWDYLSKVEGTFAIAIIVGGLNGVEHVYLMRNTYPLYYNEISYSSVVFDDMKMLRNGVVYDWWNDKDVARFEPWDVPYVVSFDDGDVI